MDWVWTDTTLSLSNWMCVEDIYANIFIIKCSRETEKVGPPNKPFVAWVPPSPPGTMSCLPPQKYPQPKGQKKKKIVKYGMGGLIILFLVAIIWFPLLFMSLVRSVVGVVNHPIDVTVTLKLGGYEVRMQRMWGWGRGAGVPSLDARVRSPADGPPAPPQPLFTMSAQQQSIQPFTPQDYEALTNQFERQPVNPPPPPQKNPPCFIPLGAPGRAGRARVPLGGGAELCPPSPPRWPCSSSRCTATRTS